MNIIIVACCLEERHQIIELFGVASNFYLINSISCFEQKSSIHSILKSHIDYIFVGANCNKNVMELIKYEIKGALSKPEIIWLYDKRDKELPIFSDLENNDKRVLISHSKTPSIYNKIVFRHKNNHYKIKLDEIFYFEKLNKNLNIRLENKKIDVGRVALKKMKEEITDTRFNQCNQSFIVNMSKMKSIEHNSHGLILTFYNIQDHVYITDNYKQQIIERFRGKNHIIGQ